MPLYNPFSWLSIRWTHTAGPKMSVLEGSDCLTRFQMRKKIHRFVTKIKTYPSPSRLILVSLYKGTTSPIVALQRSSIKQNPFIFFCLIVWRLITIEGLKLPTKSNPYKPWLISSTDCSKKDLDNPGFWLKIHNNSKPDT